MQQSDDRSDVSVYFMRTKATSADIHLLGSTIDDDVNTLYVGSPDTPGLPVGMADEIAAH